MGRVLKKAPWALFVRAPPTAAPPPAHARPAVPAAGDGRGFSTTYSALMSACEKAGQWDLAVALFDRVSELGCQPDVCIFNSVIAACAHGGEYGKVGLLSIRPRVCPSACPFGVGRCSPPGAWWVESEHARGVCRRSCSVRPSPSTPASMLGRLTGDALHPVRR
jgi:pentatricopeptide repeat protein